MAGGANLTAAIARDHVCAIHKENDRSRTNLTRSNRVAMDADNDEGSRNRAMSLWTVRSMKRYGDNDDSKKRLYRGAERGNPLLSDTKLGRIRWKPHAIKDPGPA